MNLSEVAFTVADESQMPDSFAALMKKFTKFDYEVSSTVTVLLAYIKPVGLLMAGAPAH